MSEKGDGQQELIDEFSIMELEQRLEFEAWCDGNCSCPPPPPPMNDCPIIVNDWCSAE